MSMARFSQMIGARPTKLIITVVVGIAVVSGALFMILPNSGARRKCSDERHRVQKRIIRHFLKLFESRDEKIVNCLGRHYIQHDVNMADGPAGVVDFLRYRLPKGFWMDIEYVFSDCEYVFVLLKYPRATAIEIYRFNGDKMAEHWNCIERFPVATQPRERGAGAVDVDAQFHVSDSEKTDSNKNAVKQHISDNHPLEFGAGVSAGADVYEAPHMILGEGNFVMAFSKGLYRGAPLAICDLFRVEDGKIVEQIRVKEMIPPKSEWRNPNGKF